MTCAITWTTLKSIIPDTKGATLVPFTYLGKGKAVRTENRSVVASRWLRRTGNAEDDGTVLYLDCGGGYRTVHLQSGNCPEGKLYLEKPDFIKTLASGAPRLTGTIMSV